MAVSNDCYYSETANSYYCEFKCHGIKRLNFTKRSIFKWWNGYDRENRIQYLKLSGLHDLNDRVLALEILVGDEYVQKCWAQTFVNNSKKLIIGFYNIIGEKRENNQFQLDTIVEVEFDHLRQYLNVNVIK